MTEPNRRFDKLKQKEKKFKISHNLSGYAKKIYFSESSENKSEKINLMQTDQR